VPNLKQPGWAIFFDPAFSIEKSSCGIWHIESVLSHREAFWALLQALSWDYRKG